MASHATSARLFPSQPALALSARWALARAPAAARTRRIVHLMQNRKCLKMMQCIET